MYAGHASDWGARIMQHHWDTVLLGYIPDLVRLQNPTGCGDVRLNFPDCMVRAQYLERFFEINVLARENRRWTLQRNLLQQVGVIPRDHIFYPRQIIFFVGFAEPDDGFYAQMPEM